MDALVAQVKSTKVITEEGAKEIKRLLQELRKQGAAAVPAIRDFLRSKENVNFDKIGGKGLMEQHTLRQALFDTLRQIGGDQALAVMVEQLGRNEDPVEIAMLARNLEEADPGVYRDEAVRVAGSALQLWGRGKEVVDVRPLFELLRDLGGSDAAAVLAQFPANANTVEYLRNKDTNVSPTVRTYALLSLASMPDGEGIPALAALAGDPYVPVEHKPELPFQALAQAAMEYDDAGETLVDLARAGKIPDRAWDEMGEALAGKYLQFPSEFYDGTLIAGRGSDVLGVESPFLRAYFDDGEVKYEQRLVAADWSAEEVTQQIVLIDTLLKATSRPAAVQALQQARQSLQSLRLVSTQP